MKKLINIFSRILLCVCIISIMTPIVSPVIPQSSITVYAAKHPSKLNKTQKRIVKNKSFVLKVKDLPNGETVKFSVKNNKILSLSSIRSKQCRVRGRAVGSAKVYVYIYRDDEKIRTLKCSVTVTPPAVSVRFRTSSVTMTEKEKIDLMDLLNLKPKNTAERPTFSVSDSSIVHVTNHGTCRALKVGCVTVTATIESGKSDTMTIYVEPKDEP